MSKGHLGVVQREKVTATCRVEFPMELKQMKEITHADLTLPNPSSPLCPPPGPIKSYLSAHALPNTMEETLLTLHVSAPA